MSLELLINNDIKGAMLSRDKRKLEALRAIKAALLLEKTGKDTSGGEIPEEVEFRLHHHIALCLREYRSDHTEHLLLHHEQIENRVS